MRKKSCERMQESEDVPSQNIWDSKRQAHLLSAAWHSLGPTKGTSTYCHRGLTFKFTLEFGCGRALKTDLTSCRRACSCPSPPKASWPHPVTWEDRPSIHYKHTS